MEGGKRLEGGGEPVGLLIRPPHVSSSRFEEETERRQINAGVGAKNAGREGATEGVWAWLAPTHTKHTNTHFRQAEAA